ncbi:MAG TPA: HAD hydrolase-like protein [Saprospiraceae bacterium]|nr:HAD hydrolase-like protein [Saprospiraceae bacterium]
MILVIFDVDGTLVHSERRDSAMFGRTYQEIYGRPFPSLDWSHFPHVTDDTMFRTAIRQHFQREITATEIPTFQERYMNYLRASRREQPEQFMQIPGASNLIKRLLEDERFELGIATGGWKAPAQIKLGHVQVPHQRMVLTGADGKATREEILEETRELSESKGRSFNKVVYVGDAPWDVRTTRNLNWPFVGIRHRSDEQVLLDAGADIVLRDYQAYDTFVKAVAEAGPPRKIL